MLREFFRGSLCGTVVQPAIVTVGSWDPFVSSHRELLKEQSREAGRLSLSSVAVLLDPNPARFVATDRPWPIFDDAKARIALALSCGIDRVDGAPVASLHSLLFDG